MRNFLGFLTNGGQLSQPEDCPITVLVFIFLKLKSNRENFRYQLMQACWNLNPTVRPSFEELLVKFNRIK